MIHHELPTTADLLRLAEPRPDALTVYLPTVSTPAGRQQAQLGLKSAVDLATRALREKGRARSVEDAFRAQWASFAEDDALWGNLSRSLVVLLAPDFAEEYVLPNEFAPRTSHGGRFDLGPLIRAVTTPQDAFALTLSSDGWSLWQATGSARVAELDLVGDHAEDAADATNRMGIRGRKLLRRLGGDEGRKVLLDRYAQVVAGAVREELGRLDPSGSLPLIVFANDPLASMFRAQGLPWAITWVPGAPDELRPDELEDAIRSGIDEANRIELGRRAESIGNGFAAGLASIDVAQVARAAVAGAVATLFYDLDVDVKGFLDSETGEIRFDDDGDDLIGLIALEVLRNSGEVRAVRADEIEAEIWNGRLLAGLRHPLA